MTQRRLRPVGLLAGLVVAAALAAFVLDGAGRDVSAGLLLPRRLPVDGRIAVVGFDDRGTVPGRRPPVPWSARSATEVRSIVNLAAEQGALAVVLVDYDTATLLMGPFDQEVIRNVDRLSGLGIVPLHNLLLSPRPAAGAGFPPAARYRVDLLSGEFSAIGAPLPDDAVSGALLPLVVGVDDLKPDLFGFNPPPGPRPPRYLPSLALRAVVAAGATVDVDRQRVIVNGAVVPVEQGRLRVNWSAGLDSLDDDAVHTNEELFSGAAGADALAGRIVFVGITDPAAAPLVESPDGVLPAVLVHANAANTLLLGRYLRVLPAWVVGVATAAVLVALTAVWSRRPRLALGLAVVVAGGWMAAGFVLVGRGWLADIIVLPGVVLGVVAALEAVTEWRTWTGRRRLARLFQEYVPAEVARDLIESGRAAVAAAGERHEVTVFFCDLRGFTPLAARLSPPQIRELLDVYYDALSPIVLAHGGTLLQYTGDEIYAAFGAPLAQGDHGQRAVSCALACLERRVSLNVELANRDLPPLDYGIGLHSGPVVAAHVGTSIRRQYSLVGEVVNLGSRCCSAARAGQVIFTDATAALVDDPLGRCQPLENQTLKGIDQPQRLWLAEL